MSSLHSPNYLLTSESDHVIETVGQYHDTNLLDEQRRILLTDLAHSIVGKDAVIYLENGVQTLKDDLKEELKQKIVMSDVIENPRMAWKSQFHSTPYGDDHPDWYEPTFSEEVKPYVIDGVTVFSKHNFCFCLRQMLEKHHCVRIKLGAGCGGQGQTKLCRDCDVGVDSIDQDEWNFDTGVVIEKEVPHQFAYSFTQYKIDGFEPFYSLGVILQGNTDTGMRPYLGTSCVVSTKTGFEELFRSGDTIKLPDDPMHGVINIPSAFELLHTGISVASLFEKHCIGYTPRINLDFLIVEGHHKLIDVSLRVGGNSLNELSGIYHVLNDDRLWSYQSVRFIYSRSLLNLYIENFPDSIVVYESEDPDFWYAFISLSHQVL